MSFFRESKLRFLYLLALAQLVGGPLVLLQVTLFCKTVVQEVPQVGLTNSLVKAWHLGGFTTEITATNDENSLSASTSGKILKAKLDPLKLSVLPWDMTVLGWAIPREFIFRIDLARTWTPTWPQAPPGPPPRV
jgi:hypothetical protein